MRKTFQIEWAANKDVANNRSTVTFSAVNGEEQYSGTFVVSSTDDRYISEAFDDYLPDHIRNEKAGNV